MDSQKGVKDFKEKLRWSLLPTEALQGTIRVLMYGAITKYLPNNWKDVKPQGVYLDAIYRHLSQYLEGEEYDKETGESHLSHALCDLLFLEYNRMKRDTYISFKDYLNDILKYDDYQEEITQEEIDNKFAKDRK